MSRRLLATATGALGIGLLLGAVFMLYQRPEMVGAWAMGMLGCG